MLGSAEHRGQVLSAARRAGRQYSNTDNQSQGRVDRHHTVNATADLAGLPGAKILSFLQDWTLRIPVSSPMALR
ncbi:hypothetical protein [Rhodococcus erythropolis]|uniref:hypothetical protein n=1 Tax=Rhodococcus erythropolis TaxID=1833 RepID=UPI001BE94AB7|nr:hypothetical protein [Rhodococcus erythropolis]MBT2269609.1 hypothetical protein [Rhodococcus erythropolis]